MEGLTGLPRAHPSAISPISSVRFVAQYCSHRSVPGTSERGIGGEGDLRRAVRVPWDECGAVPDVVDRLSESVSRGRWQPRGDPVASQAGVTSREALVVASFGGAVHRSPHRRPYSFASALVNPVLCQLKDSGEGPWYPPLIGKPHASRQIR
jgi:hypothetical protein